MSSEMETVETVDTETAENAEEMTAEETTAEAAGEAAAEEANFEPVENIPAALEAVLFAVGEAVEIAKLAEAMGVSKKDVLSGFETLCEKYKDDSTGIRVVRLDDKLQLCTKNEYYDVLIRLINIPKKHALTDVLLETLSIVAYKQPVTRLEIEQIRGVSCTHAINHRVSRYCSVQPMISLEALVYHLWMNCRLSPQIRSRTSRDRLWKKQILP